MKKRRLQMQKGGIPLIERMMRLAAALTKDEKIMLAKFLAGSVGDPLYTQSEMESKLQEIEAAVARKQQVAARTQRDMQEYMHLLRELG